MIQKYILLIICICCCFFNLIKTHSLEFSQDYDQDDDDEFESGMDDGSKVVPRMIVSARSRDPDYDEFTDENFNHEFENDNFLREEKQKSKDDIEFQMAFEGDRDDSRERDDSKEVSERGDEFYHPLKDDLEEDFNSFSSNRMEKKMKCENIEDCEDQTSQNKTGKLIKNDLVDSDKTTIIYVNNPETQRPYLANRNQYQRRQFEEETNLKVEHREEDKKPLECDCDSKIQPKIIGGSNAPKNKYPFAVAIFTLVGRGSFCGATIVSERYILTAAHCVARHYKVPRNYNIVAGRTDLNISDLKEEFVTKASHIWLNGRSNDVALVKLSQPLEFSNSIKPACFGGPGIVPKDYSPSGYNKFGFDTSHFNNLENVSKHFKKTNRTLKAIGWGYTGWKVQKINGVTQIRPIMTTKLQEVELSEVICTKEDYLICVEGKGKSPCFGDSGSPLLYNHYDKMVVVGLTSRSSSNKARHCLGAPTIYERSAFYLPWIKTLTSNRVCVVD